MVSSASSDASSACAHCASSLPAISFDEIPTELLRMIFLHVCDDIPLLLPPIPPDPFSPPPTYPALVISWICRRWRALAISTPELWAPTIVLDLEQIQRAEEEEDAGIRSAAILECYLLRSLTMPLPRVEFLDVSLATASRGRTADILENH